MVNVSPYVTVLFLAAEPTDEARLRLGEEVREIQQMLALARLRDHFRLEERFAVRIVDLTQAIHDLAPRIVHFSGHGGTPSEIYLEDKTGEAVAVPPKALAELFGLVKQSTDCVVLNACYSKRQAQAIAEHIEFVIGMRSEIEDAAAIAFATGFYQALGAGKTIPEAFAFGRVLVSLFDLPYDTEPVLIQRSASTPLAPRGDPEHRQRAVSERASSIGHNEVPPPLRSVLTRHLQLDLRAFACELKVRPEAIGIHLWLEDESGALMRRRLRVRVDPTPANEWPGFARHHGVVGTAWATNHTHAMDYADPVYEGVTAKTYDRLRAELRLGLSFEEFHVSRRDFRAIWATPLQDDAHRPYGCVSLNVDRTVWDAWDDLKLTGWEAVRSIASRVTFLFEEHGWPGSMGPGK